MWSAFGGPQLCSRAVVDRVHICGAYIHAYLALCIGHMCFQSYRIVDILGQSMPCLQAVKRASEIIMVFLNTT